MCHKLSLQNILIRHEIIFEIWYDNKNTLIIEGQ